MPVLTEQELTKLRVTIATLPIDPDIKRTWLGVIASVNTLQYQQERALAILAEAKQEHDMVQKSRNRALWMMLGALALNGMAFGITLGAFF